MLARAKTLLLASILVSFLISWFSGYINAYYLDVITGVGINIILAVSLNLINGYTGQFSLGHAGFMAVGAYAAASITTFLGPHVLPWFWKAQAACGIPLLFLLALVTGGIGAGVAGFLVGVPSLRLKGDYLGIVTLGFGEIIRVIFQNILAV